MGTKDELLATIAELVHPGKGILAADESNPTMAKRLKAIDVADTAQNRLSYRSMIFGTPGLGEFINGIIMFEETLDQQTDDGVSLPALATGACRRGVSDVAAGVCYGDSCVAYRRSRSCGS